MEIEKDSPDGVMFELSLKEWVRVCQADEGSRACGSGNNTSTARRHARTWWIWGTESRPPWFDQSLYIGYYPEKLEWYTGLDCHVGSLSWGLVVPKTGEGKYQNLRAGQSLDVSVTSLEKVNRILWHVTLFLISEILL